MGWTFTTRRKGETNEDFFGTGRFWVDGYEVLDTAQVGFDHVVQAVRRPDGLVFAAVTLIKWVPKARDGYNFGYKDVSEGDGPSDTPARILDLLSPAEELYGADTKSCKWANEWRERCRARLARKSSLKLRTGAFLRLDKPIKWGGVEIDLVCVKNARRLHFRHLGGYQGLYRIRRDDLIAAGAHEITEEQAHAQD